MPDPTISEALAEAYAIAPAEEIIVDTLEVRHPSFIDAAGNPDSMWITTNEVELSAEIEGGAPIKAGQTVVFRAIPFSFSRPRIEAGSTASIDIRIDNINRDWIKALDRAVVEPSKILVCYRCYLASSLLDGPQIIPPPTFVLSQCDVDMFCLRGSARVAIDLAGSFPRRLYTAAEFPGLIGQ